MPGHDVIMNPQTAVPELVVTARADKAEYQKATTDSSESQLEMTRRICLPLEDFRKISDHCSRRGIAFLSTAFDLVSVDFLAQLGQRLWKIPSGEITNLYNKWFVNDNLTIKMGRLTRDSFTRPNKEAGVAMLLGYSI